MEQGEKDTLFVRFLVGLVFSAASIINGGKPEIGYSLDQADKLIEAFEQRNNVKIGDLA